MVKENNSCQCVNGGEIHRGDEGVWLLIHLWVLQPTPYKDETEFICGMIYCKSFSIFKPILV